MYLGTYNRTDYYDSMSVNKDMIIATSENKVEFVTEDEFNQISEEINEKLNYLSYFSSMSTWLLLVVTLILFQSCAVNKHRLDVSYIYEDHGNPKVDDCKDVYTQVYAVTIYGDTLPIRRIYSTDCFERQHKKVAVK